MDRTTGNPHSVPELVVILSDLQQVCSRTTGRGNHLAGDQSNHGSNVDARSTVANHLVGLGAPVGSSDVHVSPGDLFGVIAFASIGDELLEEGSGGVGTAPATGTKVAGVSDLGSTGITAGNNRRKRLKATTASAQLLPDANCLLPVASHQ